MISKRFRARLPDSDNYEQIVMNPAGRFMWNDTMGVRPLRGAAGAEIRGINLSWPLDDEHRGTIRQALAARGVVFFRGQSLTPVSNLALAGRIGNPERAAVHDAASGDDHAFGERP